MSGGESEPIVPVNIPLLDGILSGWSQALGPDFRGYRNHVYRMVNYCLTLRACNEDEREKVVIAGSFHDLGIWGGNTFDYLPPSIGLALEYLQANGLETWAPEVELMIDLHHKVRSYGDPRHPLVKPFRRADLADFSLGLFKGGISRDYHKRVREVFPNAGFHRRLVQLEVAWLARHPLRPLPVLRW